MPINIAKNSFLGKDGLKRLNCAQSVAHAYKEKYTLGDKTVELFQHYGGGKAPEGMCGAYYAARYALEKSNPEKLHDFEKFFVDHAGSTKCREIRTMKKLSCLDCVIKSSEYLYHE